MKLSTILMYAAAGVAVGLLLTQTEKGNQIRRDIAGSAGQLGGRLDKLRRRSGEMAEDLMDDVSNVARKVKRKVDGQTA